MIQSSLTMAQGNKRSEIQVTAKSQEGKCLFEIYFVYSCLPRLVAMSNACCNLFRPTGAHGMKI